MAHIPALRRYARALVGERTAADDLVQDCLERAWSRAHLFRPDEDVRVWLFAIMHNLHVSSVRRRSRAPVLVPLAEHALTLAGPGAQEGRIALGDLDRALARLPLEQRAAVLLVGLEDMSYRDAAAVLSVPMGTLMSRLHRGRKQLRALLDEEGAARASRA